MGKILKKTTVFLSFCCVVIFALIFTGNCYKPKQITLFEGIKECEYMHIFRISLDDNVKSAFATTEKQSTHEAQMSILGVIPVTKTDVTVTQRNYVNIGGSLVGIKLYTEGLLVVGIDNIQTSDGIKCPAKECGIKDGDMITQVNDEVVTSVNDFTTWVNNSNGCNISITVKREEQTLYFSLKPVFSESDDRYRCGLWLRDSTAGIGTLTFTDPQNKMFAALGHAICDSETQTVMDVGSGDILAAKVMGCSKGQKGITGQIKGSFVGSSVGELYANNDYGIYGTYSDETFVCGKLYPVASQYEVETGDAQIICTVSDEICETYDIEIEKITHSGEKATRSLVIKITDDELIEKTGGIVQGMSGSPIIQNGMLVGAVTHVFLNDPQKGYGIFAETMLETARSVE